MRPLPFVVGVVVGVVLLGGVRFVFVPPPSGVHHHANFALFVDGERVDLSAPRYMEDVAACSADPDVVRPRDRIHLHEGNQDVVHVHHGGATWGHLFTNLGLTLGDDFLILDDGRRLFDGEDGTLVFVVNGLVVPDLRNRAVRSEERVLISMGPEGSDRALAEQFPRVASTAAEYNRRSDPAGCAGSHRELTPLMRLRHAFWRM